MKPQELKIGNWVNSEYDGECELGLRMLERFIGEIEHLNPIPLTEEWLLKFGFEYEHDHNSDTFIFYKENVKIIFNNISFDFVFDKSEIELKYVHQLQNLFFALTNKELEIKQ